MTRRKGASPLTLHAIILEDTLGDRPLRSDRIPEETFRSPGGDEFLDGGALQRLNMIGNFGKQATARILQLDQADLQSVEAEIGSILAKLKSTTENNYRLSEVQVGLALSGQGSIGIATVGIQASLTLVYSQI